MHGEPPPGWATHVANNHTAVPRWNLVLPSIRHWRTALLYVRATVRYEHGDDDQATPYQWSVVLPDFHDDDNEVWGAEATLREACAAVDTRVARAWTTFRRQARVAEVRARRQAAWCTAQPLTGRAPDTKL